MGYVKLNPLWQWPAMVILCCVAHMVSSTFGFYSHSISCRQFVTVTTDGDLITAISTEDWSCLLGAVCRLYRCAEKPYILQRC